MLLMGVGESYLSLLVIDSCALLSRSQPDDLEERSVERGSTKRSSLRDRERAIVSQTNTGTVSTATLGKLLTDGMERIWAFPSA